MADQPESVVVQLINADRTSSLTVRATSLESLRTVGHERFDIKIQNPDVFFCENSDGTIVEDDDYLLSLEPGTAVMICKEDEKWAPSFRRADWCREDNTTIADECDRGYVAAGAQTKNETSEDQERYTKLVKRLKSHTAASDLPDGPAGFSLDDVVLLCETDTQSLAEHVGLKADDADRLQRRLQKRLNELQQEEDLRQLKEIVADLKEKAGSSSKASDPAPSLSPVKRPAEEDTGMPAKRSSRDRSRDSSPPP